MEQQLELPFNESLWSIQDGGCPYLLPHRDPMLVNFDAEDPCCLLDEDHEGLHLIRRDGDEFSPTRFYCWGNDETHISEEEDDTSFLWHEITPAEILPLLSSSERLVAKSLIE